MKKNMTTADIINSMNDNGGFNNFRNWKKQEVAEWVFANYPCSKYVANRVAKNF